MAPRPRDTTTNSRSMAIMAITEAAGAVAAVTIWTLTPGLVLPLCKAAP